MVGTVAPNFGPGSGVDVIVAGDMCLACFGSHRGGDRIHEIGFVTSPRIRDVCFGIGWQCQFCVGFLQGR